MFSMKWMRERDLLIAQTVAFVQSVTGKAPEAVKTVTTSAAVVAIETSETTVAAAPPPDVASLLAPIMPAPPVPAAAPMEIPREALRATPLPRLDLRDDFQAEIRARVATFRAHQERFNREREAYCSATMAKVHASLREEGGQPKRPPTK
jgi:hypothetical protein